MAQVFISLYFIYKGISFFSRHAILFSIISLPAIYFERQYYLVVLTGFALYEYQRKMNLDQLMVLVKRFVLFSSVYGLLSVVFFLLDFNYFYEIPKYESYVFGDVHRLIGLDGSPAILSVFSGLSVIFLYQDKATKLRWTLIAFHLLILFWSSSRASLLALLIVAINFVTPHIVSTFFLALLIFSPFLLTWIYIFGNDIAHLLAIELFSSNRIINWVNALCFFNDSSWLAWLFGYGHMPVLDNSYLSQNLLGTYMYQYVSYSESSWIKIVTCYGLFGVFFIVYFLRAYFLAKKNLHAKRVILFVAFTAIFYEACFSVQYFSIMLMVFIVQNIHPRSKLSNVKSLC